ncbi:MAG TPA: glycerophosphodiester phosphodiesterase [Terriglobales bacterium]|nr:glycerophosphodiester phosphodiesterase [Terriglobales bacterium]
MSRIGTQKTTDYPFFTGKKPRAIGHRGAAGEAPENTFLAFEKALSEGADLLELDVQLTADEKVIIFHDPMLDRTTNGHGPVNACSLAEIKALDAGFGFTMDGGKSFAYRGQGIQVPTLEEFLIAFPQAKAIIEIKPESPEIVEAVIHIIRRLRKADQVLLASQSDSVLAQVRRTLTYEQLAITTGFCYGDVASFIRCVTAGSLSEYCPPGQALQVPCEYEGLSIVNTTTVAAVHQLGLEIFVWTINDIGEMKRLLALGVDGIITDYPARLVRLLQRSKTD